MPTNLVQNEKQISTRAARTPEEAEQFDQFWRAVAAYYRRFGVAVPVAAPKHSPADAKALTGPIKEAVRTGHKLDREMIRAVTAGIQPQVEQAPPTQTEATPTKSDAFDMWLYAACTSSMLLT